MRRNIVDSIIVHHTVFEAFKREIETYLDQGYQLTVISVLASI